MAMSTSSQVPAEWVEERRLLKEKLVLEDTEEWQTGDASLDLVGGVDLSFVKGTDHACAALVICSFPSMEVVHKDLEMVRLTAPYVAGYLAFREAEPLKGLMDRLRATKPEMSPQVVIVDGNGILHGDGFGLASHLGVIAGISTVGVAKNLYQMNDAGLLRDEEHQKKISLLSTVGDSFDLTVGGKVLGVALKTCKEATKPVFVSQGHRISLQSAIKLVLGCSKHRVPEPTRQADIISREYIRTSFEQNQQA